MEELIQLRERNVDACESVKELRKAKLTDVRSKLHELRHLESNLEMDLRKCNRELNHRRRHAGSKRWQDESIGIEILHVPGCSNYQPRFERLQEILASESVKTGIQGIPVTTEVQAKALLFPGSPTVRVNSEDVEPHQAIVPGLACRLCKSERHSIRGVVADSDLRREAEGMKIRMRVAERATPVAAVIAVLLTLSCCLPLAFLGALGLAGASVQLQTLRPWLLVSAAMLLGIGFIQLYVRRNQCQKRSPLSIALFWGAAAVVVLVILFPQVIASLLAG